MATGKHIRPPEESPHKKRKRVKKPWTPAVEAAESPAKEHSAEFLHTPARERSEEPWRRPAEKAEHSTAGPPSEEPVKMPAGKPAEQPVEKPSDKPAPKSVAEPESRPAQKSAEEPVERSAHKSFAALVKEGGDEAAAESKTGSAEKPVRKSAKKAVKGAGQEPVPETGKEEPVKEPIAKPERKPKKASNWIFDDEPEQKAEKKPSAEPERRLGKKSPAEPERRAQGEPAKTKAPKTESAGERAGAAVGTAVIDRPRQTEGSAPRERPQRDYDRDPLQERRQRASDRTVPQEHPQRTSDRAVPRERPQRDYDHDPLRERRRRAGDRSRGYDQDHRRGHDREPVEKRSEPSSKGISGKLVAAILAAALVITAAGILIAHGKEWFGQSEPGQASPQLDVAPTEQPASVEPLPSETEAVPGIRIPGYPSITIPAEETRAAVELVNPEGNPCSFIFELALADTGEVLYTSDSVQPGETITDITLSRPLEAGEYSAVIRIATASLEDGSPMNGANVETVLVAQ